MVHSRFVASKSRQLLPTQAMPNRRRFRDFFSIQTLYRALLSDLANKKINDAFCHVAIILNVWMYMYMYVCMYVYYKYIYIDISIYTDRIYMICSPRDSHHHNKTLHFSATAEIPDKSTRCPSPISVESVGSFVGRHPLHNRTSMLLSLTPCGSYSSFGATRKLLGDSKKNDFFHHSPLLGSTHQQ